MRTGLVLEGGAMRGMYTAGVLDVFMENGIRFDGVIGVSAGAITGCSFVSGQRERTIRYNLRYCKDKRMMSFYSLITTGDLVGTEFCYQQIPRHLDPFDNEAFMRSATDFYVTCTNLETGGPEYIHLRDLDAQIDYMRASASMPYVSHIVEIDGKKLLDGGCSDSIPVRKFMEMGYDKNIVVLTRPEDYRKGPEKTALAKVFYRKYPNFVRTLHGRADAYNRTAADIRSLEREGKIFVIRPLKPLQIGRMSHDPEEIRNAYRQGREDAQQKLSDLIRWMEHV